MVAVASYSILFFAALLHLAFSLGRRSISEKESAERYERQKEHFERAHKQIQNEESRLQKILRDPSLVAGNDYAEHTPFELIADRSRPLLEKLDTFEAGWDQVPKCLPQLLFSLSSYGDIDDYTIGSLMHTDTPTRLLLPATA